MIHYDNWLWYYFTYKLTDFFLIIKKLYKLEYIYKNIV